MSNDSQFIFLNNQCDISHTESVVPIIWEGPLRKTRKVIPLSEKFKKILLQKYFKAIKDGDIPVILNPDISPMTKEKLISKLKLEHESLAGHILCTSGTTSIDSTPKTYFFSLDRALANAKAHYESLEISESANILFPLPLYHSFGAVVGMLGGQSHPSMNSYIFNEVPSSEQILKSLKLYKIDILYLVPAMARLLLEENSLAKRFNYCPKKISIGASLFYQDEMIKLMELFPESEFYYTYGITEMGPRVSTFKCGNLKSPSKLISNKHEPLPLGNPLKGVELNSKKTLFIKSKYGFNDHEQEYFDSEDSVNTHLGYNYIIGRMNNMINFGGKNISPEEVESVIIKYESITLCCLSSIASSLYGEVPVLFIEHGPELVINEFIIHLRSVLSSSSMPHHIYSVEEIPVTSLGKIRREEIRNKKELLTNNELLFISNQEIPKTKTEKKLAKLWSYELGVKDIYRDSDFFILGGTSLNAASVFSAIAKKFNANLSLEVLFKASNLESISKYIDEYDKNHNCFSNLVTLKENEKEKYLYLFHAIGGNPLNYKCLISSIKEFNIYGLQATGVDGKNLRYRSIEEMASEYADQILKHNPIGPYTLGGGSLGGALAHETACLLQSKGKVVNKVIMLDTTALWLDENISSSKDNRRSTYGAMESLIYPFRKRFYLLLNKLYNHIDTPLPHHIRYFLLESLCVAARKNFVPKMFKGDIHLIRLPKRSVGIYSQEKLGWEKYVDGIISTNIVEGSHNTFIENKSVASLFSTSLLN